MTIKYRKFCSLTHEPHEMYLHRNWLIITNLMIYDLYRCEPCPEPLNSHTGVPVAILPRYHGECLLIKGVYLVRNWSPALSLLVMLTMLNATHLYTRPNLCTISTTLQNKCRSARYDRNWEPCENTPGKNRFNCQVQHGAIILVYRLLSIMNTYID